MIGPTVIAYSSWYLVGHPEEVLSSDTFSLTHVVAHALAKGRIIGGEPGLGLWFLSLGCLLVVVGCLVPAVKSSRLIINDTDPRYATILNQGFFAPRQTPRPQAEPPGRWQYG